MAIAYESNPKHGRPWQMGRKGALCSNVKDKPTCSVDELLQSSVKDGEKRFNFDNGIAYAAQCHGIEPNTGTELWHGYPIPWVEVPPKIRNTWIKENRVRNRQMKKTWSRESMQEYLR